jgi:hypothetical protein
MLLRVRIDMTSDTSQTGVIGRAAEPVLPPPSCTLSLQVAEGPTAVVVSVEFTAGRRRP